MPLVCVPRGTHPTLVTMILPFYQNPDFFWHQVETWRGFPDDLRLALSVVVVDDGSPTSAVLPVDPPCRMRLFRIGVDVRWNWLAARNIGAHHADEGWLLLTDMDHVLTEDALRGVVYGVHDEKTIYAFSRREHTGEILKPHPNSFLLTREMFWRVGGYDERLSGYYGTDGDWRRRCAQTAPLACLTEALVRHEYQGDSSTTAYARKQPEDAAVKQIVSLRPAIGWRPKVLSFPYDEIARPA